MLQGGGQLRRFDWFGDATREVEPGVSHRIGPDAQRREQDHPQLLRTGQLADFGGERDAPGSGQLQVEDGDVKMVAPPDQFNRLRRRFRAFGNHAPLGRLLDEHTPAGGIVVRDQNPPAGEFGREGLCAGLVVRPENLH